MTTANEIFLCLQRLAPVETQESYDNAGFLFGSREMPVERVLLALDVTDAVIEEAAVKHVQLIVTHHPLIFGKFQHVFPEDPTGRHVIALAKKDLCVISMHTNLDKAEGGVNDALVDLFAPDRIERTERSPYLRIGIYDRAVPLEEFLQRAKDALKTNGLRYTASEKPVKKFAVLGGAGDGELAEAYALGCDTFLTADIHYHAFLNAKELGMNLIDGDHFCTENPVMAVLKERLEKQFPEVHFELSAVHAQTVQFF